MIAIRFPFEITREMAIVSIGFSIQKHNLNEQPMHTRILQTPRKNMKIKILINFKLYRNVW